TLSRAAGTAVKVGWSTESGTAVAPGDFAAATGAVTFAPGETSKAVTVALHDDPVFEEAETVGLRIGSPDGATIGTAAASAEIADDDPAPGVAVDSVTVTEGDTGVTQAYFTVDLDRESSVPIVVALATQPGTATPGADYDAVAQTIAFAPGQRTASFVVPVHGDLLAEPTESFGVTVDGVLAAFGTVTDDD
ncbi:MAG TPA: Calx-beta domain-containing protein, partial [Solirubrobacteraceae bacterium]|nr:Calx-beta domain-containing protein [Solirubrobacteraceae bacterium]